MFDPYNARTSIYFAVVCACGDGGYVADDAGYAQPGFGFEGGGL